MPLTATVTYDLGKCIHYNMIAYQLWYDQLITQLYKAFQLFFPKKKNLRGGGGHFAYKYSSFFDAYLSLHDMRYCTNIELLLTNKCLGKNNE